MNRRHVLAVSGAVLAGALAGCLDKSSTDDTSTVQAATGPEPDIEDDGLRELVHQTNGFAFDLYRALLDEHAEENLFSSPVSISVALAMTYTGAREETRAQMRDVLRYTLDDDEIHDAFATLQREFDERGADIDVDVDAGGGYDEDDDPSPFELSLVNAVWGQAEFPFKDAYLDLLHERYGVALQESDFTSEADAVREEINAWVADQTEDRIDELLPENALDELTRLVLVNAIYFLANWKYPFQEGATEDEPFTALDGSEHDVAMMRKNRSWQYVERDGVQAVDLPYIGEEASMLVILPPEDEFESYEQSFDGDTLAELVDGLDAREGTVALPRFEFETSIELREVFEGMGMNDAFDPHTADFGAMAHLDEVGENLFLDEVYHDAFVAVDEEGTEAAAATGAVMQVTSAPADPFEFTVDRPFLFVIRDRVLETVLFVGRGVDPATWE